LAIHHLANKKYYVDERVKRMRHSKCMSCRYYIRQTGQCQDCLCFVALKTKLKTESCPKGFWGEEPI